MSDTIKVIHMCDHVVPEIELVNEKNKFTTGPSICQISENPVNTIDRIEYGIPEPFLSKGNKSLVVNNRLKIDNFSYGVDGSEFSTSETICQNKALLGISDKTRINGIINGMCFPEGFMFKKIGMDTLAEYAAQFVPQNCVLSTEPGYSQPNKLVFTGNGTSATISVKKSVCLANFQTAFLYMQLEMPANCTSLKIELQATALNEIVFEKANTALIPGAVIKVGKKIEIPESFDVDASGTNPVIKVTVTFANAAASNNAVCKMHLVPVETPSLIGLSGTGYESYSEAVLQYIFSNEGGRDNENMWGPNNQGRMVYISEFNAYSGDFMGGDPVADEGYGWDVINPETGSPIYQGDERVIIRRSGRLSPGADYQLRNNRDYNNTVYWVNAVDECIGISRGDVVTAPSHTTSCFIVSDEGQNYVEGLAYEMALYGDLEIPEDYEELISYNVEYFDLQGIPFGKTQSLDISTITSSSPVVNAIAGSMHITDLFTGYVGFDLVKILAFDRCVEFTTAAKEYKTFCWLAPEIDATDLANIVIDAGQMRHFSCPVDQCIKLLIPKGTAVNLQDAKDKLSGIQFTYELDYPSYSYDYFVLLEGFDFTRIGQNAIQWDPSSWLATDEGTELVALVETKKSINRRYDEYSCPRCNGNGWYVSTTGDASKSIDYVTGSDKMVQDFLKILLTDIRYYSPGTAFITLKGFVKRDQRIEDLIVLYIKDAEMQLRQLQYNMSIAGSEISEYEELKTVIIESIDATSSQDRIYVEIRLVNMASEYTTIGLAV